MSKSKIHQKVGHKKRIKLDDYGRDTEAMANFDSFEIIGMCIIPYFLGYHFDSRGFLFCLSYDDHQHQMLKLC